MSDVLIQALGIHFAYGETPVLQGIDLNVSAGEIFGLVGADGAGKSTLLRIAVGQLAPTAGSMTVLGQDSQAPALRAQLAFMPQGFGLYQDLSVHENLYLFADLHGIKRSNAQPRVRELLQRTGLSGFEVRRAGKLSGGMRQKLALACALISEPRVMFLDEPTTGVDPLSRRAFWDLLEGVREEGVAILYATANMDEAERCDRVGILEAGRLKHQGTPAALATIEGATLVSVSGAGARSSRRAVRELPGVSLVFPVGARLHVWLEAGVSFDAFRSALARVSREVHPSVIEPSLHDAALHELAAAQEPH
jgi:ABC-2 type transport system ATP-binding protein